MPIQSARSTAEGWIEVYPEFQAGLEIVDGLSHIILIYIFHHALNSSELMIKPFLDDTQHGVFSTRWYQRPNPIGLSVVRLLDLKAGTLKIQNVDMLDGTPLLDIKPYIPEIDQFSVDRIGWYGTRTRL